MKNKYIRWFVEGFVILIGGYLFMFGLTVVEGFIVAFLNLDVVMIFPLLFIGWGVSCLFVGRFAEGVINELRRNKQ